MLTHSQRLFGRDMLAARTSPVRVPLSVMVSGTAIASLE